MAFVGSSGGRCAAATSDLGARRPAACADRLLGPCTAAAHPRPVGLHHAPPAPKPTPAAAPARGRGRQGVVACRAAPSSVSSATKDNEYNRVMQQQMGWGHLNPYEYHFDRGLYYHEVAPNLICGTQPRNTSDVRTLREREGITTILNLQQDKDMQYWGVKVDEIRHACSSNGIALLRRPARDFDPHSLRKTIPGAVQSLREALANGGRVYVHCTAGLGRAPAVCIAYMYWFNDMGLDQAYKALTDVRPCGPKRDAVRGATYDVLSPNNDFHAFERLPKDAYASLSEDDRFALQYRILRGLV